MATPAALQQQQQQQAAAQQLALSAAAAASAAEAAAASAAATNPAETDVDMAAADSTVVAPIIIQTVSEPVGSAVYAVYACYLYVASFYVGWSTCHFGAPIIPHLPSLNHPLFASRKGLDPESHCLHLSWVT
jgi:hypothetical protein